MTDTETPGDIPPSPREAPVVVHRTGCYVKSSQNWIHTQTKHLREHAPFVLSGQTENLEQLDWVPPHYKTFGRPIATRVFDRIGKAVLGYRPALRWQLSRRDARLLHAHFGPVGYKTLSLAEAHDVPLITTFYGYDLSLLPAKEPEWIDRYQELFENGDHFLTEGRHMKQCLVDLGCPEDKITVHHLGVEVESIPYQPRVRSQGDPLRVLSAGRFVEKKGFPDAIRAFAQFLRRGGRGELTIVGGLQDPERDREARQELRQRIREQNIADHVTLRGFLPHDELLQAYLDHHVFLAPSVEASNGDTEGGAPVTLIEASATGMAIVGTRHCDIPEVVNHGTTGLLAEEGEYDLLADHLWRLYSDSNLVSELGKAGRNRIEDQYSAAKQGQHLDAIYRSRRRAST
ncbi:glycosyltransferase [Salinibacter ruber]|uniref:glycosyltransferase n=1 Tax=Salinibacter ruber TaxID=146919 RepID=UPI0020731605|nr:glycosyltransferase [Salinibacter ruber]